ncbi:hypothetical protein LJC04_01460 [Ruminococcaceae bacterium OttesenSCG-928-O06]|nr:hypothetical protein [Ruminococcaceae bacterium OttesenSCG-928-O06]
MSASNRNNRLNHLMNELGIRSVTLAQASGGDHSLITKWRRGERPLTRRSRHLMPVAKGLIALDTKGLIPDIVAPWQQAGESTAEALCEYLLSSDLPALPPRTGPQQRITSGGYTVQHQVYLGQRGFRSAALAMLDYVTTLPPRPGDCGCVPRQLQLDGKRHGLCGGVSGKAATGLCPGHHHHAHQP